MALNISELLFFALADSPWLEVYKEESRVGALHLREQRKVIHRDHTFNAGSLEQCGGDFLLSGVRTLCRGAVRKL